MTNKQRWERVLQAVDAEARRAEALLAVIEDRPQTSVGAEQTPAGMAIPADWLLPYAEAGCAPETIDPIEAFNSHQPPRLPELEQMPPVPQELGERILSLRTRILQLQDELARAMREWRPLPVPAQPGPGARQPVFVDRQL